MMPLLRALAVFVVGVFRRGLDEHQDLPPAGPMPRQPGPEDPVTRTNPGPPDRSVIHRQLMLRCQDLEMQRHT